MEGDFLLSELAPSTKLVTGLIVAFQGTPILIYRVSIVYVPYIYRISTVVDSEKIKVEVEEYIEKKWKRKLVVFAYVKKKQ